MCNKIESPEKYHFLFPISVLGTIWYISFPWFNKMDEVVLVDAFVLTGIILSSVLYHFFPLKQGLILRNSIWALGILVFWVHPVYDDCLDVIHSRIPLHIPSSDWPFMVFLVLLATFLLLQFFFIFSTYRFYKQQKVEG